MAVLESICSYDGANSGQDVNTTTRWRAQSITLSAESTIESYVFAARRVANDGNLVVSLFTNSSDAPGSEISGTSVTIAWSGISSSKQSVTATLATPKEGVAAGTYWIVWRSDDANSQGVIYVDISTPDSSVTFVYDLSYPSSWTTQTDRDAYVVINGTAGGGASIPRSNPFSRPFRQSLGRGGF